MNEIPRVLTIAGSDSSGGAGIQADLKTIAALGGYGMSVVTALTAQNTTGVSGIEAPSADFVALQLSTVLGDIPVDGAKTGMLFNTGIIEAVAGGLEKKDFPLVVDPVCVAQSGDRLLEEQAVDAMVSRMFPLADLLTPNIPEAEMFTGMKIESRGDIMKVIEKLLDMGPKAVLVKGGHMDSVAMTDWLASSSEAPIPLMQKRVRTRNNHGTGCALSAAIATGLGSGLSMVNAVRRAQEYLNLGLRASFDIGEGSGPPNHLAPMLNMRARADVLAGLDAFGFVLERMDGLDMLVPEVRMNVALATPHASGIADVAAYGGRITRTRSGRVMVCGCPGFGASSHMAKVVLAASSLNPEVTCAANIAFNSKILKAIESLGMVQAWFDRADEPREVKEQEGSTLEWGTYSALEAHENPRSVDVVCDRGEVGKEPIVRVLASGLDDLEDKLRRIVAAL